MTKMTWILCLTLDLIITLFAHTLPISILHCSTSTPLLSHVHQFTPFDDISIVYIMILFDKAHLFHEGAIILYSQSHAIQMHV